MSEKREEENPDEPDEILEVVQKKLKNVGRYSYDLTVPKTALQEAHRASQTSESFTSWMKRKRVIIITKIPGGLRVEIQSPRPIDRSRWRPWER